MLKNIGRRILWQRARDYLHRTHPIVIGIAGSSGKTLVKDALTLILTPHRHVRSSPYSYNSRLGVALTILGINQKSVARHWLRLLTGSRLREIMGPDPEIVILELGADAPGDIDFFSRQLPFNIGIITNAQSTHLRLFTSKEMVAHELASLIVDLPRKGQAILNIDDPLVKPLQAVSKAPVTYFGEHKAADIRLIRWHRLPDFSLTCELKIGHKRIEFNPRHIIASYQLPHLLSALAALKALNLPLEPAITKLQAIAPPPGRMRHFAGINSSTILDDSYSSSPESVSHALDLLAALPARRRVAILGDMLDLGGVSITHHEELGRKTAKVADVFVGVGENMTKAGAAALNAPARIDLHHFHKSRDVGQWLSAFIQPGDLILVKGSRALKMEQIVKRLLANPTQDTARTINV